MQPSQIVEVDITVALMEQPAVYPAMEAQPDEAAGMEFLRYKVEALQGDYDDANYRAEYWEREHYKCKNDLEAVRNKHESTIRELDISHGELQAAHEQLSGTRGQQDRTHKRLCVTHEQLCIVRELLCDERDQLSDISTEIAASKAASADLTAKRAEEQICNQRLQEEVNVARAELAASEAAAADLAAKRAQELTWSWQLQVFGAVAAAALKIGGYMVGRRTA